MKITGKLLTLYAITDRSCLKSENFFEAVESALRGGATLLQLREKDLSNDEYTYEAVKIKEIALKYNVPLIINDNVDVALRSGADGVHLGQGDMPAAKAREILGEHAIIGQTAKTVEQALTAEKAGADYLGVGAAFPTSTKTDTWVISHDVYREITSAISIPVVAIGGINEKNAFMLGGTGISGIAVVSALFGQNDVFSAAKNLRKIAEKTVNGIF